jgi:hypothetical protein
MYCPGAELRGLRLAGRVRLAIPAAHGEVAAAGAVPGFDDRAVVPRLLQLVGGHEAGDPAAEDDDLGRRLASQVEVGPARCLEVPRCRLGRGGWREAHGAHGGEHGPRAPSQTNRAEEAAASLTT